MKTRWILILLIVVTLSACARKPSVDNFYFGTYSEAEALYNRQDYERAIQKYQGFVDENPEGNLAIISRYYMARSHAALGHKEDARALFEKIMREHKDSIWANFSQTQLAELDKAPAVDSKQ